MTLKIKGNEGERVDVIELKQAFDGVNVFINDKYILRIYDDGEIAKNGELIGRWKE